MYYFTPHTLLGSSTLWLNPNNFVSQMNKLILKVKQLAQGHTGGKLSSEYLNPALQDSPNPLWHFHLSHATSCGTISKS
jgi:hypothetical protein